MAGHGAPGEGSNASCGKPITLYRFYIEIMAAASWAIRLLLWILGLRTSSRDLGQSPKAPRHCNNTIRKAVEWSLLPTHLLITIAEELLVADISRLPAVCKTWAWSLGLPCNGMPSPPRYRASFIPIPHSVPWMLLPKKYYNREDFLLFLKLSDNQIQTISPVPEMVGRGCVGASPDGWLVTLDLELNPRVLNPLTREEFPLPSLYHLLFDIHIHARSYCSEKCFCNAYILKIVLTSAPPFGVAIVFIGSESLHNQLAFARVGDASWAPVPLLDNLTHKIEDVMYCKEDGRLYAVNASGFLMFFDLHICDWPGGLWKSPKPLSVIPTVVTKTKEWLFRMNRQSHLVFLSGHFLRIFGDVNSCYRWEAEMLRLGLPLEDEDEDEDEHVDGDGVFEANDMSKTSEIRIKKLVHMTKEPIMESRWIPANASDLKDQAVFIGCNHVFSVPATERPGLKNNSIYFTETYKYKCLECRVNVRDAETVGFHWFFSPDSRVKWFPPLWFMPCHLRFELLS